MHKETTYIVYRDDVNAYADHNSASQQITKGDHCIPIAPVLWGGVQMLGILLRGKIVYATRDRFEHSCMPMT